MSRCKYVRGPSTFVPGVCRLLADSLDPRLSSHIRIDLKTQTGMASPNREASFCIQIPMSFQKKAPQPLRMTQFTAPVLVQRGWIWNPIHKCFEHPETGERIFAAA